MKKLIAFIFISLIINVNSQTTSTMMPLAPATPTIPAWKCGATSALLTNMNLDNTVDSKFSIYNSSLSYTNSALNSPGNPTVSMVIPVVFHIIYDGNNSTNQVMTYQQIQWQLATLNAAFSNSLTSLNLSGTTNTLAQNTGIQFCLAKSTQSNNSSIPWSNSNYGVMTYTTTNALTNFISFHPTLVNTCLSNLATITNYTSSFPPNMYLNIFCVDNISDQTAAAILPPTLIGVGTFPWMTLPVDGIIMRKDAIGNNTFNNFPMFQPLGSGNILAHEAGHYLGLFHTFEQIVGQNLTNLGNTNYTCPNTTSPGYGNMTGDLILDTPSSTYTLNVLSNTINTCIDNYVPYSSYGGTNADEFDQLENFMTWTDNSFLSIFTDEQRQRMWGCLNSVWTNTNVNGQRLNLTTPGNLIATGVNTSPSCGPGVLTSAFIYSILPSSLTCSTVPVQFSVPILPNYLSANSYTWNFGDGSPNSYIPMPIHTFTFPPNSFTVTLTTSDGISTSSTAIVININHDYPKIVGQSGNGFPVCRGSEQTIYIQFPANSYSAIITNGVTSNTVFCNFPHTSTTPTGVYKYPFTFTANANVSYSILPIFCGALSTGVANFTVTDCCTNLVSNGDFESGNTGYYSNYNLNTTLVTNGSAAINSNTAIPLFSGSGYSINLSGQSLLFKSNAYISFPGCHSLNSYSIIAGQVINGLQPGKTYYASFKTNQGWDTIFYCGPKKINMRIFSANGIIFNKNFVPSCVAPTQNTFNVQNPPSSGMNVFTETFSTTAAFNPNVTYSLEIREVDNFSNQAFEYLIDNILLSEMNPPNYSSVTPVASTICPNSTVQIIATNQCLNISQFNLAWTPTIGLSCTNCINPIASPSVSTVYTLIATPPASLSTVPTSTLTSTVIVLNPNIVLSPPFRFCPGEVFTLSVNGVNTYTWLPSLLTNSSQTLIPLVPTIYTLQSISPNCNVTSTVLVNPPPTPILTVAPTNFVFCGVGQSLTLTAGLIAGTSSFTWLPSNQTGSAIIVTPSSSIIYTVVSGYNSCGVTQTVPLSIFDFTPNVLNPQCIQANQTVSLNAIANVNSPVSYTWMPGNLTGSFITVTHSTTQVYTVTASNGTCNVARTLTITIVPSITINPLPTLCIGSISQPIQNYLAPGTPTINGGILGNWINNNSCNGVPCSYINLSGSGPFTLGVNTFSYYTLINSCNQIQSFTVNIQAPPIIATNSVPLYCYNIGPNLTLTATTTSSNVLTYNWQPGNLAGSNPTVNPSSNIVYTVSATDGSCVSSSQTLAVTVSTACCNAPNYAISPISVPNLTMSQGWAINQDIVITSTLVWVGDFQVAPNVSITIAPTGAIIAGSAPYIGTKPPPPIVQGMHVHSCGDMWNGFIVQNGGKIKLREYDLIEDAKVAILSDGNTNVNSSGSNYDIDVFETTFNRNGTAIAIKNYTQTNTNQAPFNIRGCVFTCRDLSSSFTSTTWPIYNVLSPIGSPTNALAGPYTIGGYSMTTLKTPSTSVKSQMGVYLENCGLTFNPNNLIPNYYGVTIGEGLNTNTTSLTYSINIFDNLAYGIYGQYSSFNSYNNVFQNIYAGPYLMGSSAIVATNPQTNYSINTKNTYLNLVAPVNFSTYVNKFYNCNMAIYAYNVLKLNVQYDEFYSSQNKYSMSSNQAAFGNYGINVISNRIKDYQIKNCKFINIKTGIAATGMNDYYNLSSNANSIAYGQAWGTFDIANNFFSPTLNGSAGITEYMHKAISISNLINSRIQNIVTQPANGLRITFNNISNVWRGIEFTGFGNPTYTKTANYNQIRLVGDINTNSTQWGINFNNNSISSVHNNTITGFSTNTNVITSGVYSALNGASAVRCNSVTALPRGIEFAGQNAGMQWQNNIMFNDGRGMQLSFTGTLSQGGSIGPQGQSGVPSDNIWQGVWTNGLVQTHVDNFSNASSSGLWLRNQTSYVPIANSGPNPSRYGAAGNGGANNYTFTTSSLPPACTVPTISSTGNGVHLQRQLTEVAADTNVVVDETAEINQFLVYNMLDLDTLIAYSNDTLASFYQGNYPADLGKLRNVEETLASGDFNSAASDIANFDPQTNIQSAYKTFFQLYYNYKTQTEFSEADNTQLLILANQCPFSDGPAIFKARILYSLINQNQDIYYDEDCPEKGYSGRPSLTESESSILNNLLALNETKKISKKINTEYIVFPNPAKDKLYIRSKISNANLRITISDMIGRVFISKNIVINEYDGFLNLDLPNGIYFVSLYDGQKISQTRKIIIAK